MMKRFSLLLVLVLTFLCTCSGKGNPLQVYANETYNLQFTYPGGWLPEKLKAKTNHLELFSPNAFNYQDETLDLVCGIKVEVYFDIQAKEIAQVLNGSRLCYIKENKNEKFHFYCLQTEDCLIIITPIERKKHNHLFIAYIPETSRAEEKKYKTRYNDLIVSLD